MRKVLMIASNSLLLTLRDRKAVLSLVLVPLILILILGVALKGVLSEGKINPFTVVVVNADQPARPPLPAGTPAAVAERLPTLAFGQIFLEDVLGSERARQVIITREETDIAAARREVADGGAAAAIFIPAAFTADSLGGKGANLEVYTDPGQALQAAIAIQVARSFTEGVTTQLVSNRLLPMDQAAAAALSAEVGQSVKVTELPAGVRSVSAMQYYAAAMAVMYMLMTAIQRAGQLIDERENGTLQRMLISPTSRYAILAGQVLGSVIVPVAQFLVLMLGTHYLFGVYWGPVLPALLLGFAFALAAGGIGVAAAGVLGDRKAADMATGIVGMLFAALSGAMMPLYLFPDSLLLVAKFVPNYWALQGFLDQMAGLGLHHLWLPVGVLTAVAAVTGAVGVMRLSDK